MIDEFKSGDVFGGRFKIASIVARRPFQAVYEAFDQKANCRCLLKLFRKESVESLVEYNNHLMALKQNLSSLSLPGLLAPVEVGETENYVFQSFQSAPQSTVGTLDKIVRKYAPLDPGDALGILAKVAAVLKILHARGVVHADIKPSSIIVGKDTEKEIYLVDFGMARRSEADNAVSVIGTYRYLHPALKGYVPAVPKDAISAPGVKPENGAAGPYVDLYALGIAVMEMLTGKAAVPSPLTEERLRAVLQANNHFLREAETATVTELSNLLFKMLTAHPGINGIDAEKVAASARTLEGAFRAQKTSRAVQTWELDEAEDKTETITGETTGATSAPLQKLTALVDLLENSTRIMTCRDGKVQTVVLPESDAKVLAEVKKSFADFQTRVRAAWESGTRKTMIFFLLTAVLISGGITLALVPGMGLWALIFGGVGVIAAAATFIRRPYDRIFPALVLAQELEMIHVHWAAAFQIMTDLERRIEICRETAAELEALLGSTVEHTAGKILLK